MFSLVSINGKLKSKTFQFLSSSYLSKGFIYNILVVLSKNLVKAAPTLGVVV